MYTLFFANLTCGKGCITAFEEFCNTPLRGVGTLTIYLLSPFRCFFPSPSPLSGILPVTLPAYEPSLRVAHIPAVAAPAGPEAEPLMEVEALPRGTGL